MAELLARQGFEFKSFTRGQKVEARVIKISSKSVLFDIGGKSEGIIKDEYYSQASRFIKNLKPGDKVRATVINPEALEGGILLSLRDTAAEALWDRLNKAKKEDKIVYIAVKNTSDKGLLVEYNSISGFIPLSQIGKGSSEDLSSLIGKKLKVKVLEVNRNKNRVLFSERAVSEKGQLKLETKAFAKLEVGKIYDGVVSQLADFGAFVIIPLKIDKKDIEIEGLVHVSEIAWGKVEEPKDVLSEGQKVKVKLMEVKDVPTSSRAGKLSLSIKQVKGSPWEGIEKKYHKDDKVEGKVIRKSGFGAFVSLEPGIEGLIHITKIPPGTKLELGQEISCFVEDIDKKDKRISLGLVLTSKPIGYK